MSSQATTAGASPRPPPLRLRRVQDADLRDKVVLVRVDHNCVKRGAMTDAFRVDATVATLYTIVERGGRPILITHVGRPFDPKARRISCSDDESVIPVVRYLSRKLGVTFAVPDFRVDPTRGILDVDTSVNWLVEDLKNRRVGGVYLPNARWFAGEEGLVAGPDAGDAALARDRFATQLAGLADVFVNDAFGSWQPHVSTLGVAKLLPSYAGLLMQRECDALRALIEPKRPFVAVLAGSKLDTKIGTVRAVAERCDALLLGGVLYNAYVAAKRGVDVEGVSEGDVELAREFLLDDAIESKLVPLETLVESDSPDGCGCVVREGRCETKDDASSGVRRVRVGDLRRGESRGYFLDVAASSFDAEAVREAVANAETIFVNAVMGYTSKGFHEGTAALDALIASNARARKYFGGGDTIHEFKSLSPGLYMSALEDPRFYLFTGGGTVLKALELGGPEKLATVEALAMKPDEATGAEAEANAPKCMRLASCDCGPTETTPA